MVSSLTQTVRETSGAGLNSLEPKQNADLLGLGATGSQPVQSDDPNTSCSLRVKTDDNFDSNSVPPHVIYTLSPDLYPWALELTESFSSTWCVGGAWALVVLPETESHRSGDSCLEDLNIPRLNAFMEGYVDRIILEVLLFKKNYCVMNYLYL